MQQAFNEAASAIDMIELAPITKEDSIIDDNKVNWYVDRFCLCSNDNVPDALTAYAMRAAKDKTLSAATKMVIMQHYLNIAR